MWYLFDIIKEINFRKIGDKIMLVDYGVYKRNIYQEKTSGMKSNRE